MQSTPVAIYRAAGAKSRERGFALLITITLLAFLVLLLVSLASLTRVETQVAGNNQQLAQARQNALLALNVALGQLQKYAGPDQRVTTPASFALGAPAGQLSDAKRGLTTPVSGTRPWLGVWGNSSVPGNIYAATPEPVFLNWLVSGNEQTPAPIAAADGQITSPAAAATPTFRPSQAPTALTLSTKATDALKINSQDAILLVGPTTAGNTAGALDRFVAAPLVSLQSSNVPGLGSAATTIGRYAYWVGDEGVKARYNLRDKLIATDPKTSADARYRLLTPARDGIEVITGLTAFPVNSALIDNIQTSSQLRLAASSVTEAVQQSYIHDFTTISLGLLTNTQTGGLRTDLTHALSQSTLGANFTGKTVIPSAAGAAYIPTNTPNWAVLKSFYDLGPSVVGSTPVEVRAASSTEMGVSPVIVQNRLMVSLTTKASSDFNAATGKGNYRFHILIQPIFVIANPYSFPIKATNGVEFSYGITTDVPDKSEWGMLLTNNRTKTSAGNFTLNRFDTTNYHYQGSQNAVKYLPILANTKQLGATPNTVLNNVRFKAPAFTLQPGQIMTFSLAASTTGSGLSGGIHNLKPSVDSTTYYRYDSGTDIPCFYSSGGSFVNNTYMAILNTAEAMTLQMALPGSDPADGTKSQPQTGTLQAVVNADLSSANAKNIPDGSDNYRLPPFPGTITQIEANNLASTGPIPQPLNYMVIQGEKSYAPSGSLINGDYIIDVSGYAMWLSLPELDLSLYLYDSATSSLTGTFRAYADFNLGARNFAMPPVAPLLVHATNKATTFETVPPYARKYLRGPATHGSTSTPGSATYSPLLTSNVATPKWGINTDTSGHATVILYDAPKRTDATEASLFSVGQLQHADLTGDDDYTSVSYQPRYAVGNSFSSPYVSRDKSVASLPRQSPSRVGTTDLTSGNVRMFDLSYLMNTVLWDDYFFSSLLQSGASAGTPANQRLVFSGATRPTAAQIGIGKGDTPLVDLSGNGTTLLPEKAAARYLMIKGAFNINSTSVEAWKAVLSGGRSLALNGDSAGTPFSRSLNQTLGVKDAETGDADTTYAGYRRLTDAQITALATKIVEQVRARGPFVSLAHFVNRTLSADALGSQGALQTAIDAVTPAINSFPNAIDKAQFFATPYVNNGSTTDIGNRSTGVPGWVTQADILQAIGSMISARSDTFTIRTYGDVVDPLNPTTVVSRAWCEATVQRFPDYVDTTQSAAATPASATNKTFGRKFQVISFRWLGLNDI
ncbi:MAG: hypothetical protein ACAH89_07435 [Rariglobus sp.]